MVSFFFLRKKTICFISLDKASAKSNDCWNSFDALLGLTPLRFNKLCTVFRFDVLRVTFSCFLSTAFFFYFLCCTRILIFFCVLFFKSLILSFSIALFFVNSIVTLVFSFPRRLSSFWKVYINDERVEKHSRDWLSLKTNQ